MNSYKDLTQVSMQSFIADTASTNPVPGGGAVTAYVGAEAVAMLHKVFAIIFNKKYGSKKKRSMEYDNFVAIIKHCDNLEQKFLKMIDYDVQSYKSVKNLYEIPKDQRTEEDKTSVFITATKSQNDILTYCVEGVSLLSTAVQYCNTSLLADVAGCSELLMAVSKTNFLNLLSNVQNLPDDVAKLYRIKGEESFRIVNTVSAKIYNEILRKFVNNEIK